LEVSKHLSTSIQTILGHDGITADEFKSFFAILATPSVLPELHKDKTWPQQLTDILAKQAQLDKDFNVSSPFLSLITIVVHYLMYGDAL
jgi:hypothetical protein